MDVQSYSAGGLADHGTSLERVVDALNGILFHGYEEARGELRVGCASVEECWGGMGKVLRGHEIVGFDCFFNVVAVDADGDAHDHVLGTFRDFSVDT